MTLQSSGAIAHSQINTEIGYGATTNSSLNDGLFRILARRNTNGSTIAFSDFLGKTRVYVTGGYSVSNVDSGQSQVLFYGNGAIYTNGYVVIDLLMVGGGGGGGANGGGGGGAGGVYVNTIGLNGGYGLSIGGGGAGTVNTYNVGTPGGGTYFAAIGTIPGGDGGASRENRTIRNLTYGCGGGNASGSLGSAPVGWPGTKDAYGVPYYSSQANWALRGSYGYAGGLSSGGGCNASGSGGGGAGSVGNNSGSYAGGAGGTGYLWNGTYYAGGGGGGVTCYYCGAPGGAGGGGGSSCPGGAVPNATYYGGGGGGYASSGSGGNGYAGVIVMRGSFGIRPA